MITSETFYRAECDHGGCPVTLPDAEEHEASHWPHHSVLEALGEERGRHDETWAVVGQQTFCPRHKPGNAECTACDGRGYFRAERAAEPEPGRPRYEFTDCPVCGDRGYLVGSAAPQHQGARAMIDNKPRTALAQILWDASRAQDPEDFMPTVMTDLGSCLRVANAILEAGYARRVDVLEAAANAYDNDDKLYAQLEKRSLASEGRDVDGIQDIGAAWLRALATPETKEQGNGCV